jgi:hypothetical protein
MIIMKLVEMLKAMPISEDASVNKRFLIAILQKISIKTDSIPILVDLKLIDWSISFIERSLIPPKADPKEALNSGLTFALDFNSALLANVIHSKATQSTLLEPRNQENTACVINNLLSLIDNTRMPTSVLMHLLICLSYMNKERFSEIAEKKCNFSDRIA